jgi:glycosyltransferase involved in cell wall biosynthesis
MLTVVVPTKNRAKYLEKLFDECIFARYSPVSNVIVCNDASTDDTPNIIDRFTKSKSLHVITNENSIGGIRSIVSACKLVQTEYIKIMSDDDYFYPMELRDLMDDILAMKACYGFGRYRIEDGSKLFDVRHRGLEQREKLTSEFVNLFANDNYMFFAGAVWSTRYLPRYESSAPFDLSLDRLVSVDNLGEFRSHDWDLALNIALVTGGRGVFHDKYLAVFRKTENQLSGDDIFNKTGRAAYEMSLLIIKYLLRSESQRLLTDSRDSLDKVEKLLNLKVSLISESNMRGLEFTSTYLPALNMAFSMLNSFK